MICLFSLSEPDDIIKSYTSFSLLNPIAKPKSKNACKNQRTMKYVLLLILLMICSQQSDAQSFLDSPFLQPVSKKYLIQDDPGSYEMKKMVIDRDDNVHALTDKGLYIIIDEQLVSDQRFRPLKDLVPVDVTIQSGTKALYYLYEDVYLTNAFAGLPYGAFENGAYQYIAVNQSGDILLTGQRNIKMVSGEDQQEGRLSGNIQSIRARGDNFYAETETGISILENGSLREIVGEEDIRSWVFGNHELFIATSDGYYSVSDSNWSLKRPLSGKVPVFPMTSLAFHNGTLWPGTEMGMFSTDNHEDYRYWASKRWLSSDDVLNIAVDSKGNGYALTMEGISIVHFKTMTLNDKANYFYDKVRKRHLRLGLIGETRLSDQGDVTTAQMVDTDNDGLWTAFYMGSEIFRYAATNDPVARGNAMETFMSYERLLSINQLDGFPSRTFERKGYSFSDPYRWRASPEEQWEWKGHTSTDEYIAYLWVAGLMNQLLDLNKEERQRVADFIDSIMMHIMRNDYYLVDIDGKPTLWGRWNPEFLNWYPETVTDRKLNSTHLTAGLQLAYALTGKEIYKDEAFRMFEEHGYLDNIQIPMKQIGPTPGIIYEGDHPYPFEFDMGDGGWNHSDDEMYFLTYWVLFHYAFNDDLKRIYADVITDHWQIELPERNSVWSLISYGTSGDIDLESVKWHLREFQLDMRRWEVRNSHRNDLEFLETNFRGQSTKELIPPSERMTMRYNANPFVLDGGRGGDRELAGDEFLLPYWMGRYLGVIIPLE